MSRTKVGSLKMAVSTPIMTMYHISISQLASNPTMLKHIYYFIYVKYMHIYFNSVISQIMLHLLILFYFLFKGCIITLKFNYHNMCRNTRVELYADIQAVLNIRHTKRCILRNSCFFRNVSLFIGLWYTSLSMFQLQQIEMDIEDCMYSVRRLIGSIWANSNVITITEWFN